MQQPCLRPCSAAQAASQASQARGGRRERVLPRHCGNGDGRFLFGADLWKTGSAEVQSGCLGALLSSFDLARLDELNRPHPGSATDPIDCLLSLSISIDILPGARRESPHRHCLAFAQTPAPAPITASLAYPACFGLSAGFGLIIVFDDFFFDPVATMMA